MYNLLQNVWNSRSYLIVLSAVFLSLSFPPFPFPFLQIPGFILLFRLIDLCDTPREAAYWSYPLFVLWNLAVTYWLMLATLAGGVGAILANSVLMTLPVMFMKAFKRHFSNLGLQAITYASAWTLFEYLHHHWDLAWPWLTLGNAWSTLPGLIQYISITGIWGVSFWVVAVSVLFYHLIQYRTFKTELFTWSVFAAAPLFSLIILFTYQDKPDGISTVVITQPNYDTYDRLGGYSSPKRALEHTINLSDSLITDSTDAVFWPENAVRPALYEHENDQLTSILRNQSTQWGVTIVTGTTYYDFFKDQESPALVRVHNGQKYIYYNSAVSFSPDNEKKLYYKGKLVPIVERIPFLSFFNKYNFLNIDWSSVGWLGKGNEQTIFEANEARFPALVCYDSVFPNWVRGFVSNRSNFIAIITNDGWWGRTSGHIQHFEFARLRAIETRRWIVRSANNGISGIINSKGQVNVKTAYKKTRVFSYNVPLLSDSTLYLRWGDWLPKGAGIWFLVGTVWLIYRNRKR